VQLAPVARAHGLALDLRTSHLIVLAGAMAPR
jgi:hypothetical protein